METLCLKTRRNCPILNLYIQILKREKWMYYYYYQKKYTLGYNGKGDYKKLSIQLFLKIITSKEVYFDTKIYIFTGWQIINKEILNKFTEKNFSLKKVYDLAEKKEDYME